MTDDEAALLMKAKLLGQPISYVYYRKGGKLIEEVVVGDGNVKIPIGCEDAWYSWNKDLMIPKGKSYVMDDTKRKYAWRITPGTTTSYCVGDPMFNHNAVVTFSYE